MNFQQPEGTGTQSASRHLLTAQARRWLRETSEQGILATCQFRKFKGIGMILLTKSVYSRICRLPRQSAIGPQNDGARPCAILHAESHQRKFSLYFLVIDIREHT